MDTTTHAGTHIYLDIPFNHYQTVPTILHMNGHRVNGVGSTLAVDGKSVMRAVNADKSSILSWVCCWTITIVKCALFKVCMLTVSDMS